MRLNMYRGGKAIRNKAGKVVGGSLLMNDKAGGKDIGSAARIAPDRRWFGNTPDYVTDGIGSLSERNDD